MTEPRGANANRFGGDWTSEKLNILESYLDAYTTALKNQPFSLMYIDAFAGTGAIILPTEDPDAQAFIAGSASRAIAIKEKPFDRLVFVERNRRRYSQLTRLREEHLARDIRTENSDANSYLSDLQVDWSNWRGVLFLDPFATEVEWTTIERIASFNALDTWILVPISAITRMLPTSRNPDDIPQSWADRLTRVFGDDSWKDLYRPNPQLNLFGTQEFQRDAGTEGISKIYKEKLKELFKERFLETSKVFLNSKNSPLFEFVFCAGNPRGARIAKNIAGHLLR